MSLKNRSRFPARPALAACLVGALQLASAWPAHAATLDVVRERGELRCAVHPGSAGMSIPDSEGQWTGLFADYCRALAAAVLGDANKVRFVPVTSQQRFTVLQTGEVDVLARTTTWTLTRDSSLGLNFTGILFYDGQGFLVPKSLGVKAARDLDGAAICIKTGTTAELNTADFFARLDMEFRPVVYQDTEQAKLALFSRRCDALTTDASQLTSIRVSDTENPDDYQLLPERLSKEPLGPTVRSDDDQWFDINKWTLHALLAAEEFGITAENAKQLRQTSRNATVLRLLGVKKGMGLALGLDDEWAYRAIRSVGNYAEIYQRNIAPLGIERGLNRLYRDGGLMYPLPIR